MLIANQNKNGACNFQKEHVDLEMMGENLC